MNTPIIEISNLIKKYNNNIVLDIESFTFYLNKTYLLIGQNGSGKSTLIKSIIGIIKYQGKINVNTNIIGYLPERYPEISLIKAKTFLDNLVLDDKKSIINEKTRQLSHYFDLDINKNISNLSKGNLQKVMIIQTLINNPKLLIFDEPLNGLDTLNQEKFLTLINYIRNKDKTIIITTHYPKYYESLYDVILYIENGILYENKTSI